MSTTPSAVTKELLLHALDFYFTGAVDGQNKPLFKPEDVGIAETWMEEQETSEEERIRIDKENGTRMKDTLIKALASYEYQVLDESHATANAEYETLREAQTWTDQLTPGEDIF